VKTWITRLIDGLGEELDGKMDITAAICLTGSEFSSMPL
jgi:hypothetical protein